MATLEAINNIDGTVYGKFTISADEALDIRKHALECAVRAFQGNCTLPADADIIVKAAKIFEEHLTRNAGNG